MATVKDVRMALTEKDMTQMQLAKEIGCHYQTISNTLRRKEQPPVGTLEMYLEVIKNFKTKDEF
jgi:DNA-binding XRE family transcriptional regulator